MSTVRIQVRRGTASQWTSANPVLEAGEIGFESDTNLFKFGNGDDAWSLLPYAAADYTAFQNTLDDYLTVGLRGTANGVASLNSSGKVPNDQIDSGTWATREIVSASVAGLSLNAAVGYATTSALAATYTAGTTDWFGGTAIGATLTMNSTGVLSIDGSNMTLGERILVKNQSNKLHNGLYTVTTAGAVGTAAVLTRTDDATDVYSPAIYTGSIVYVQNGTSNEGKQFVQITKGTGSTARGIKVGTDEIEWTQYSGAAKLNAGTGISISGDTISIDDTVTQKRLSDVSDTEISYLNGVTSAIQTQIDAKANLQGGATFTGTIVLPSTTSIGDVSSTEIGYVNGVTSSIQTQIDTKAPTSNPTFTGTVSGVTKAMVGLGNVDNTADSAKPISTATQTALDAKSPLASPTFTGTVTVPTLSVTTTATGITKTMVGLGNVDNTSDANKPVSTATQTALDLKANLAGPTFTGTVVLPSTTSIGNVSATELGYVDGVTSAIQTQIDSKLSKSGGTMTGDLTLAGAPTSDLHAATKAYVDNVSAGLNFHQPVRVATTANITLSGTQTIDGVSLSVGDRVLVKDQTTQTQNGIYVVASDSWTRATDADNTPSGELAGGDFTLVLEGTVNSGYGYVCSNTSAITIGTTNITYSAFNAAKAVTAGSGLTESTPGTLDIATGGVTSAMIADGTIVDGDISASAAIAQSKISGLSSSLALKANLAAPSFTGGVTVDSSGIIFTDGTQTKEGVVSRTPIIQKSASYTLSALTERDSLIEVASASATTITIPPNSTVAYPVGTSIDILQTSTGQVTIAAGSGVTVNATPGLKLRTQWSSATLFKRATDTWVVMGDLSA